MSALLVKRREAPFASAQHQSAEPLQAKRHEMCRAVTFDTGIELSSFGCEVEWTPYSDMKGEGARSWLPWREMEREEDKDGAYAYYLEMRIPLFNFKIKWGFRRKKKNLVTWTPRESRFRAVAHTQPRDLDALIMGDSWCDGIDTGCTGWPTRLAAQSGLSEINVAQGGSTSADLPAQLTRALEACRYEHVRICEHTIVLLHSGGNDFLYLLLPCLGSLIMDIARVALWRRTSLRGYAWVRNFCWVLHQPLAAPARGGGSCFRRGGVRIRDNLYSCLSELNQHGVTKVILSGLPICSAMPLARVVVGRGLCLLFGMRFAEGILEEMASVLTSFIQEMLATVQKDFPEMDVRFFDEASSLTRYGKCTPGFWQDGHHPSDIGHSLLAQDAAEVMHARPPSKARAAVPKGAWDLYE
ncbi:hypothetical protein CYMTET_50361 [Cymbomonas tetramitiformis]|uniref:Uncharacterized protein n=1 Tax=Cymbomonas tetramitiformis TaxID=36881 RepID=A0AAE0BND2_9CHLO|nr:hypothetical protein CYMTET_50361 [Cymbomonas tetramitiformis]